MSALLYLPGVLVILFRRVNIRGIIAHLIVIIATHVVAALPFLREDEVEYLTGAFNFGRAFLYKWTVNWRFLDEETFLSKPFARILLLGHVTTLVAFGLFKWCRCEGGTFALLKRGFQNRDVRRYSPAVVPITADCECAMSQQ